MVVVGTYAYVSDYGAGLKIINIGNPAAPSLVGTFPIAMNSNTSIAVSGNYAYLNDYVNGAVRIVDISNPASPNLIATYLPPGGFPGSVAVSGHYLYIGDFSGAVEIVDVSNPASPSLVGSYLVSPLPQHPAAGTPSSPLGFSISGNYLYVADQGTGLYILNLANPTSPSLVGSYDPGGNSGTSYTGIQIVGNFAYLSDSLGSLVKINVSDPALPQLAGVAVTGGTPWDVFVANGYAYVSARNSGLEIFDINSIGPAISGGGNSAVGALAGNNSGAIDQSYASEVVSGYVSVGGLIGANAGSIYGSYASAPVVGLGPVGGLVGSNSNAISQSYASGSVNGTTTAGGLVGDNSGPISQAFATGNVFGSTAGGLIGSNDELGVIAQDFAIGVVDGYQYTGGLVGSNLGLIEGSYATGAILGNNDLGGLVGINLGINYSFTGTITNSFATGPIQSVGYNVGGLVGENDGTIFQSYATGEIVQGGVNSAGGLVGTNFGSIDQSYASGTVTGVTDLGGLVGHNNNGLISNSYATGSLVDPYGFYQNIGGLVGYDGGSVTGSYSTGVVPGTGNVGGLIGGGGGGQTNNSYWDVLTSGQPNSFGGSPSPPALLKGVIPAGFDQTIWAIDANTNYGYPYLQWQLTNTTQPQLAGSLPTWFSNSVWGSNPSINNGYPYLLWQVASTSPTAPTILTPTAGLSLTPPPPPPLSTTTTTTQSLPPAQNQINPTQSNTQAAESTPPVIVTPIWNAPPTNNNLIPNSYMWTGLLGPITPGELLNRSKPLIDIINQWWTNTGTYQDWTFFAKQMGYTDLEIALLKLTGFQAAVYLTPTGQPVLVFQSTKPWYPADLATDALNDLYAKMDIPDDVAPQYGFAALLAAQAEKDYPFGNLLLTGFSLGGGLAAYAGSMDKIPAVTFDPAGLTQSSNYNSQYVLNFQLNGDPAQAGGSLIGTTIQFGQQTSEEALSAVGVPSGTPSSSFSAHGKAMNAFNYLATTSNLAIMSSTSTSDTQVYAVGP